MRYTLYYWSEIPGRGEFVRLALEDAGASYSDIAREPGGEAAMMRLLKNGKPRPFAAPFLKAGKLLIAQTANILLYLGEREGLAPKSTAGRLWTHQLQLTIADLVTEVHDSHHPIGSGLYYKDQKAEAKRRSADFLENRAPKFLGYFESVLKTNGPFLNGRRVSYADLSLFHVVVGLRYAFPTAMTRIAKAHPRVMALHDRVAERPRIVAYLGSERRLPFNEMGIFRRYDELDG